MALGGPSIYPIYPGAGYEQALSKANARIAKLEELVEELLVVYYHQDDDRINALRKDLDI